MEDKIDNIFEEYQMTYRAEGTDEQCEKPHIPSDGSGITFGHGIDFRYVDLNNSEDRTKYEVVRTIFLKKDISEETLRNCIGKYGVEAKIFAKENLQNLFFTPEEQKWMFSQVFQKYSHILKLF